MPEVLRVRGFRFFFFSREGHEPRHIHVEQAERYEKFWLDSVWARPLNADDLLQRCYALNLQAVFCGHFHGFTERPFRHSIITTDRCCARVRLNHDGSPEKGWFVSQAVNGEIKRRFVEFHPTEQEALNAGMLDR